MFLRRNALMFQSMFQGRNAGSSPGPSAPRTPLMLRSRYQRRCARPFLRRNASRSLGRSTRTCRGAWTRRSAPAPSPPHTGAAQVTRPQSPATTPPSPALRRQLPVTRLLRRGETFLHKKTSFQLEISRHRPCIFKTF